jgi:uncharacterized protein
LRSGDSRSEGDHPFRGQEAVDIGQSFAVREVSAPIAGLGPYAHGLRIAHLSDLHFRRWLSVYDKARNRLRADDYDLLLITGDFSGFPHKWRHAASMIRRFFDGISPRLGAFAVLGNHDRPRLADQPGLPFRLLRNEQKTVRIADSALQIVGLEQCEGAHGDVCDVLPHIESDSPAILLAHYPSTAFDLPAGRVQLQLSGHTHGGQIRLPKLGCVFTNDKIPSHQASGLHRIGDTLVHVSAGIGVSGPIPYRIGCPAEITMITLTDTQKTGIGVAKTGQKGRNSKETQELVTVN